jgi:hypothetical protein
MKLLKLIDMANDAFLAGAYDLLDEIKHNQDTIPANQEELIDSIGMCYKDLTDAYYMIHEKIDSIGAKTSRFKKRTTKDINLINKDIDNQNIVLYESFSHIKNIHKLTMLNQKKLLKNIQNCHERLVHLNILIDEK